VTLRTFTWLLAATAACTVAVEVVSLWYAPEVGFGLVVRTGWALLRSLAFLVLIWQVRNGRAGARPFGLILAVTTIFSVARLVVPRHGLPAWPGIVGFAVLTLLCLSVVAVLYRSSVLDTHLVRRPARRSVPARILTARVAALSYAPLMLVPALVAVGAVFHGRLATVPAVVAWLVVGFVVSYVVLFTTYFLLRGHRWARTLVLVLSGLVLAVQLPLCWWLLGLDGLVRDGTPLVVAVALAVWGVTRSTSEDGPPMVRQGR